MDKITLIFCESDTWYSKIIKTAEFDNNINLKTLTSGHLFDNILFVG